MVVHMEESVPIPTHGVRTLAIVHPKKLNVWCVQKPGISFRSIKMIIVAKKHLLI